jgi:uncharacterized membrane protein YfhO
VYTYLYRKRLPRGYFIGNYEAIADEYDRLNRINEETFNPAKTAILEEDLSETISIPDSSFSELTDFTPNKLSFNVYTDKTTLFVISELFYPPGWKIFIDNEPVKHIYKTNHAVQSIILPQGNHQVEVRFEPDSFHRNIQLATVSVSILYIIIVLSIIKPVKNYFSQKD